MAGKKIIVEGLAKLPAFCHAVMAGDFIYVSGILGTKPNTLELVEGGTGPQTTQTLRHIETILRPARPRWKTWSRSTSSWPTWGPSPR